MRFCAKKGLSRVRQFPPARAMSKKASRGSWASEAPGSRPAASQPPACVSSAGPPHCRCPAAPAAPASAGSPGPPCCGRSWHGPQLLHVAVLRVEAPRRVRRRSEGARVLHGLHAPLGEVLVVLELVGVVLQDPELRGRLLLHVLGRAVHRLVGPRVVGRSGLLKVVAPLPALARHPRGQVLLQRLDAPVHHGNGVAVLGPLRAVHGIFGQLPVQRGKLVAQVRRDHEVPVVPRQLPRGALGGAAHRLGVLVLQRFHGGLPGEDVHHHQAVLRLPPRVLAEVDEVGLQPVVGPLGGRLAQRARPGRLHLPAHVGLQRLEGHGLRHVEVALPRESAQLPRVTHVEVVGQVPQRLHVYLFFGPRLACQAPPSTSSSRAWKPLHTPQSTLVR